MLRERNASKNNDYKDDRICNKKREQIRRVKVLLGKFSYFIQYSDDKFCGIK